MISKANDNYLYVVIFLFVLGLTAIMLALYMSFMVVPQALMSTTAYDELVNLDLISITDIDEPVPSEPMPGVRCPKCAARSVES